MKQNTLTPEQAWQKLIELDKVMEEHSLGKKFSTAEKEMTGFLKTIAEEPNAEAIYLFILEKKDDILQDGDLATIASATKDKPFAEKILTTVMNHPEFRGFNEDTQISLLANISLLDAYWQQGNDFSDDAELAICTLPNWNELLTKYLSYGHGLCAKAQKKIFALPKEQALKLVAKFISGITEKNHAERSLCNNGLFFLLKSRPLFDLYVEKMSPFFKEKKYIFPQTIAFVARRKGWL